MKSPSRSEASLSGSLARHRIIKFRACQNAAGVLAASYEHLAILQQRGGVAAASGGKASGVTKPKERQRMGAQASARQ